MTYKVFATNRKFVVIFFTLKGRPESIFPTLPHVTKCTLAEVPALDYDTTKELQQRLTYG